MNRVALVTVLVLASVAAGAATAAAVGAGSPDGAGSAAVAADNASENNTSASLGASISAFMQSNAEQADEAVDQGMWSAAFNASDRGRQDDTAEAHVNRLQQRLDEITAERRELIEAYRNGSIGRLEFQARMSALDQRRRAVAQSVEATERVTARANVTPPGLDDLKVAVRRGPGVGAFGNVTPGNVTAPVNVTVPAFGDRDPFANVTNVTPGDAGNANRTAPGDRGNGSGPPVDVPGNASDATNVTTVTSDLDGNKTLDGNETLDALGH
jgi:hypothetical protein